MGRRRGESDRGLPCAGPTFSCTRAQTPSPCPACMSGSGISAGDIDKRAPTPMSYRGDRGRRRGAPTCAREHVGGRDHAVRATCDGTGLRLCNRCGVSGRKTPPGDGRSTPDLTRENSREARRGGERCGAAQRPATGRRTRVRLPDTSSGSPVLDRARSARRRRPLGSDGWRDSPRRPHATSRSCARCRPVPRSTELR